MIRHILRQGLQLKGNRYFYANEKQQSKQMAIGAATTIRYLSSLPIIQQRMKTMLGDDVPQESQQNKRVSLSKLIIKNLNDYKKKNEYQLSQKTIKKFSMMLDPKQGVELPIHLRGQQRMQYGQNFNNRFSFFPNRLVTIPIFKTIRIAKGKNLVYGQAGISKTVSFVFYSYLSRMITLHELEYDEPIALDIPRLLYFSYKPQPKNVPQFQAYMASLIQSNFSKNIFARYQLQKFTNPLTVYRYLTKICQNMKFKVIVDQFNSYTAQCRNFNTKVENNSLKLTQTLENQSQWLLKQKDLWFSSAINFTSNNYIYNSSQNVDEQVLGRAQVPKISFDMDQHTNCNRYHINYYNYHHNAEAQREIVNLLFFQLQKTYPKIKAQATEKLLQTNLQFFGETFVTPNQIRQLLRYNKAQIQNQMKKIDWSKQNDVVEKLAKIIQKIDLRRISEAIESAKRFAREGSEHLQHQKLIIILKARKIIQDRIQKEQEKRVNQSKKGLRENIHQFIIDGQVNRLNVDKNLFEVIQQVESQKQNVKKMVLKYSGKEFLKVTNFVYQILMIKALSSDSLSRSIVSAAISADNGTSGKLIENSIISILRIFPILLQVPVETNSRNLMYLQKAKQFYHFNMQMNLFDRLEHLIPKQDQYQYSIGVPMTSKDQRSPNSASIDFIIIRRVNQSQVLSQENQNKKDSKREIQVYSYDLTVGKTKILAKTQDGKLQKAQRLIKNTLKNYCEEEQKLFRIKKWNHIVLCQPQNFEYLPTQYIPSQQILIQPNPTSSISTSQNSEIKEKQYYKTTVKYFTRSILDLSLEKSNRFISKDMDIQLTNYLQALKFFKAQIKY